MYVPDLGRGNTTVILTAGTRPGLGWVCTTAKVGIGSVNLSNAGYRFCFCNFDVKIFCSSLNINK